MKIGITESRPVAPPKEDGTGYSLNPEKYEKANKGKFESGKKFGY